MSQRFKKMSIVKIFECRLTEERKSIINWLIDSKNKKIDNWLIDWFEEQENRQLIDWLIRRTRRSTIDLLIEFSSLITIDWLTFRTRKSTIESFREDSFCCFTHEDSFCCFVILSKNLSWTSNEIHSSLSKKKLIHSRKFTS